MRRVLVLVLSLLLVIGITGATGQELTGKQILDQLDFNNVLSASGTAELTLITENDKGAQRQYSVRVLRKSDDNGEKQFLEYLNPADVRGTKFLSLAEKDQEEQMWLFMPAIGRERRIATHMTGDSFMGTDFTYEEIGGNIAYEEQYSVERLEDQVFAGIDCYVLLLTASEVDALYDKIQMWVWQEKLVPLKLEFWDSSAKRKTLVLDDFRLVDNELIPHSVVMADDIKGTRTILDILNINQEEVSDDVFTLRYLRR